MRLFFFLIVFGGAFFYCLRRFMFRLRSLKEKDSPSFQTKIPTLVKDPLTGEYRRMD